MSLIGGRHVSRCRCGLNPGNGWRPAVKPWGNFRQQTWNRQLHGICLQRFIQDLAFIFITLAFSPTFPEQGQLEAIVSFFQGPDWCDQSIQAPSHHSLLAHFIVWSAALGNDLWPLLWARVAATPASWKNAHSWADRFRYSLAMALMLSLVNLCPLNRWARNARHAPPPLDGFFRSFANLSCFLVRFSFDLDGSQIACTRILHWAWTC